MVNVSVKKIGVVFALLLGLSGCLSLGPTEANYNKKLDSWLGHPIDGIVQNLGKPQDIVDMGNGNQGYVYQARRTAVEGGGYYYENVYVPTMAINYNNYQPYPTYAVQQIAHPLPYYNVEYACDTLFEVDPHAVLSRLGNGKVMTARAKRRSNHLIGDYLNGWRIAQS